MGARERFDAYMEHLSSALGHADRVAGLKGYCTGLMLPLERKSVEPMAAGLTPVTRVPVIKRCTTSLQRPNGRMRRCLKRSPSGWCRS